MIQMSNTSIKKTHRKQTRNHPPAQQGANPMQAQQQPPPNNQAQQTPDLQQIMGQMSKMTQLFQSTVDTFKQHYGPQKPQNSDGSSRSHDGTQSSLYVKSRSAYALTLAISL